jgi:hypothetical protein
MSKFQRPTTVPSAKKSFKESGDTGGLTRPIGGHGLGTDLKAAPPGSYDPLSGHRKSSGYGATPRPTPINSKIGYRGQEKMYDAAHPGFKAVQSKIAARSGVSKDRAGAILGAATRRASPAAKKANPRLKRVPGADADAAEQMGSRRMPHPGYHNPAHADAAPAGGKMEKTMHEFKHGELHSGSKTGPEVTNRKQAIAIGLSQARKAGEE